VSRATRVLVANHREIPAGLLVDEVMDSAGSTTANSPPTAADTAAL